MSILSQTGKIILVRQPVNGRFGNSPLNGYAKLKSVWCKLEWYRGNHYSDL